MQPEEISEHELNDVSEESDCDEKDEAVPDEKNDTSRRLHIRGTLRDISRHWKFKGYIMYWKLVDPNSEKSMTICKGIEKMLASYYKL